MDKHQGKENFKINIKSIAIKANGTMTYLLVMVNKNGSKTVTIRGTLNRVENKAAGNM